MITNCIVVGLDDSATARAAHRWAAAYAHATGKGLCAVHVVDWPIGLNASAVKSGTRLRVPKQDVAEPYWRGMHRVFDETSSPPGSMLQFAFPNNYPTLNTTCPTRAPAATTSPSPRRARCRRRLSRTTSSHTHTPIGREPCQC